MKFKVGDKVVRTEWCADYYTVKQGSEYVISKVDEYNNIYLQGVYDNNGQPDRFNPDNFELVEDASKWKQMSKFNKGDKVRCVKPTLATGVNVGDIYTIKCPESHNFGEGWHVILEEVISTPNENVLELYEENVVKQTTFEKAEYTDKSIFRVINANGSCFEVGDLVVIDSECGDYAARFKLLSEYGQYRKPYMNWLTVEGLEYVGELGSDMVKENTAIQKDKAYCKMSPDTLIPISIDGNDFEVSLGGLLLARYIIGEANGSYLYSLYCALDVIDKEYSVVHFESQNPVDCSHYQKDLFSKYFKDEVKESKKLEIKAQIESLQEQLKTLD